MLSQSTEQRHNIGSLYHFLLACSKLTMTARSRKHSEAFSIVRNSKRCNNSSTTSNQDEQRPTAGISHFLVASKFPTRYTTCSILRLSVLANCSTSAEEAASAAMARAGPARPFDTRVRSGSASTNSVKSWRLVQVARGDGPRAFGDSSRFEGFEARMGEGLDRPTRNEGADISTIIPPISESSFSLGYVGV